MNIDFVSEVFKYTVFTALTVAAPLLITALGIGLIVSIFQSVTQIQEQTLTFVPKVLAIATVMVILLPWMINKVLVFTKYIFEQIGNLP